MYLPTSTAGRFGPPSTLPAAIARQPFGGTPRPVGAPILQGVDPRRAVLPSLS